MFFFNDTATTEIYTLSLHDALPIFRLDMVDEGRGVAGGPDRQLPAHVGAGVHAHALEGDGRSEEHTSELQSRQYLVCRLLLEKKNTIHDNVRLCQPNNLHDSDLLCL